MAAVMSSLRSLADAFQKHRRRLAPLVLVAGALVVAPRLVGSLPREVHVRYELGPDHGGAREARIDYVLGGEAVQSVRFDYASGAPAYIDHRVSLAPGHYDVLAEVRSVDGSYRVERGLEVPAEGMVRIALVDEALASAGAAP